MVAERLMLLGTDIARHGQGIDRAWAIEVSNFLFKLDSSRKRMMCLETSGVGSALGILHEQCPSISGEGAFYKGNIGSNGHG